MSDFNTLRSKINSGRKGIEAEKKSIFNTREKLKRIQRAKKQVIRTKGSKSEEYKSLVSDENKIKTSLQTSQDNLEVTLQDHLGILTEFEQFTDPRTNIKQFSNEFPIMLFPVRLETRFKKVTEGGVLKHQLWVRIFPDECSIDTFDDIPSESEIAKVRSYWINVWKAGTATSNELKLYVTNKKKGAWRELMGIMNAGRSYWLTQAYHPLNASDIPQRESETDLIWIICTEEMPASGISSALEDYWKSFFDADGDPVKIEEAFTALVSATGGNPESTKQLIEKYTPINIADEKPDPSTVLKIAFLQFPKSTDFDTKLSAWSGAARVNTLPDRFVLIGYQKDNPEAVINQLGNIIPDPLIVGPDPGEDIDETLKTIYGSSFETLADEEKASKYVEYLSTQSETKWLFDFNEAIKVGMGFKVDLSPDEYDKGFEKLYVLGVKLSADSAEGQTLVEELIKHHHYGESGFSILPQGIPTNNTDETASAFSELEDADESYERYFTEVTPDDPGDDNDKVDGKWFSEFIGIDADEATLKLVSNYYHKDQCEARAMDTSLWDATLGYFMESMLTPVFNDFQVDLIRWLLINHVSGRGRIPAIRIGDQPYGVLAISDMSQMAWLKEVRTSFAEKYANKIPTFRKVFSLLSKIKNDWEGLINQVAYVGKSGDAHEILLQALGLHASSVEFDQRYAESFDHLYNTAVLSGIPPGSIDSWTEFFYKLGGMLLLQHLGYVHDVKTNPRIPILEKYFFTKENDVNRPIIDDQPLSEDKQIRAYTDSGGNYIEWFIDNAENNHQNIKDQKGFTDNKKPDALLYDMLRHALNLQFHNTGLKLYRQAEILNQNDVVEAKIDSPFIGIAAEASNIESKWDYLYREEPLITSSNNLLIDHISMLIKSPAIQAGTEHLREVISALNHLKESSTAALERAFIEHLDLCSYRLDAWLLGLVNLQLYHMRYGDSETSKKGLYIGAYGLVEDLKPDNRELSEVDLADSELKDIFDPDDDKLIHRDSTNFGFVHAPSINHAQTAAVLRNAYKTSASESEAEIYKVNLSSERVRLALLIIEGMQQGQSLGALLGYQLERGLHDNTELELDTFIYELRKVFPLNANRLLITKIFTDRIAQNDEESVRFQEEEKEFEEDKAVTKIEARNVIDGLALLEHIKSSNLETYPFGYPTGSGAGKLLAASAAESEAINAEVQRLMNIRDAVADLAIAESVHQVVQGNYERASGALDTYSKGNYPQIPEVIKSPGSGVTLNHRFGIHLNSGIDPAAGATPRSQAEAALNDWLIDLLPAGNQVGCKVYYTVPVYDDSPPNARVEVSVFLDDLGLQPIDLLYMLDVESEKNLTSMDDHILKYVYETQSPRLDSEIAIHYQEAPASNRLSFFELAALLRKLRTLTVSTRPLRSSDLSLQTEASKEQDADSFIDKNRIEIPKTNLDHLIQQLKTNVIDPITPLIDTEDVEASLGNKEAIIEQVDQRSDYLVDVLKDLSKYGLTQAGFGYLYDHKGALYAGIYKQVLEYRNRWNEKSNAYSNLINFELPAAGDDDERREILQKAERAISSGYTIPVPDLTTYESNLATMKLAFDAKLNELNNFLNNNFSTIREMIAEVNNVKMNLDNFDSVVLEIEEQEKQIVVFTDEFFDHATKLHTLLLENAANVQDLLDSYDTTATKTEQVELMTKAASILFGEDFKVIPEFNLAEEQGVELLNSFNSKSQLLNYQTTTLEIEFPVDEWLYGIARVRENLAAWESMVTIAEGIKDCPSIDLTPIQLPYLENDSWLGLSFPEDYVIESDKLLYTAYLTTFDPTVPQCGLLVDEWTEIIPAKKETSGLTFHYDQPNNEPPQSILLVTPASFNGSWNWQHLENSIDETLRLARIRAIEPAQINQTSYATFLPATVAATTVHPVTIMLNYLLQTTENSK